MIGTAIDRPIVTQPTWRMRCRYASGRDGGNEVVNPGQQRSGWPPGLALPMEEINDSRRKIQAPKSQTKRTHAP